MLKQILFVLFAVIVTALISEYFAFKKQSASDQKHLREISLLKRDKNELENLKLASDQELERAKVCIKDLEDWKNKAIQCSPEIESLVRFKIAKKEAEQYLASYPALSTLDATYVNYPTLVNMVNAYKALSNDAKLQTKISIDFLEKHRDLAFEDYIRTTTEYMQNADIRLEGIPEHLPQLTKIMEWFNNVPVLVRSEISGNLIISLSMKEAHAKYLTGLAADTVIKDEVPQNKSILNRLFIAINSVSGKAKNSVSQWFKKWFSKLRSWATLPFSYKYPEDIFDAEEIDNSTSPVSNKNKENE